jgi:hypothetical protein
MELTAAMIDRAIGVVLGSAAGDAMVRRTSSERRSGGAMPVGGGGGFGWEPGESAVALSWRQVLHGRRTYDEPALRSDDLEALARLAIANRSEVQHAS